MTIKEAAEFLNLSISTIRRKTDSGDLPYYKTPGGHRRFKKEDLEHYIKTTSVKGITIKSR